MDLHRGARIAAAGHFEEAIALAVADVD